MKLEKIHVLKGCQDDAQATDLVVITADGIAVAIYQDNVLGPSWGIWIDHCKGCWERGEDELAQEFLLNLDGSVREGP